MWKCRPSLIEHIFIFTSHPRVRKSDTSNLKHASSQFVCTTTYGEWVQIDFSTSVERAKLSETSGFHVPLKKIIYILLSLFVDFDSSNYYRKSLKVIYVYIVSKSKVFNMMKVRNFSFRCMKSFNFISKTNNCKFTTRLYLNS